MKCRLKAFYKTQLSFQCHSLDFSSQGLHFNPPLSSACSTGARTFLAIPPAASFLKSQWLLLEVTTAPSHLPIGS